MTSNGIGYLVATIAFVIGVGIIVVNLRDMEVNDYNKFCLDGVQYYSRSNQLAPVFNRDSTVKLCEVE